MKTCDDCGYYDPPDETIHKRLDGTQYQDESWRGSCLCPKFIELYLEEPDDSCLIYWDYESYAAGFYVGPKFGCIHHKEKE